MVAIYRAIESERPDALFHDPLARKLAGEHGQEIVDDMSGGFLTGWSVSLRSRMVVWMVAIRTCIIDKFIQSTVSQGFDAVLNLGAGLDTRPYRMTLPKPFIGSRSIIRLSSIIKKAASPKKNHDAILKG